MTRERLEADYLIETAFPPELAAEVMAGEQSSGTFVKKQGMTFNVPDRNAFRQALTASGFYKEWKGKFGDTAWKLLQKYSQV